MAKVLICDDDLDIVAALKIYLSADNHELFVAHTGREALECVETNEIQLVLMDIMMPGMDGIEATAKLREAHNIPVILLTAKSESSDKVLGLDIGADDYITKPFNPAEVLARVRSQLRRYTRLGGESGKGTDILAAGGIEMNDALKTVSVDGEAVSLTPMEYNILRFLLKNPNRVYSSAQIYEAVWNDPAIGSESSVAVHIRHLREKIEINPGEPRYIKVVWGHGYKLEGKQ